MQSLLRRGLLPLAFAWLIATTAVAAFEPVDDYIDAALVDANLAKNAAARCESKAAKAAETATAEVLVRAIKAKDECRLLKNDGARAEYALKAAQAERERQKNPPPPPPPPPPQPPITALTTVKLSLDGAAYDVTRAVVLAPFNRTARYELPLKDGLVFVVLDTPAHGHASYIVERRKPGVFGAALPLVDYSVTITDSRYNVTTTQTVTGHGQWQRWRVQNKPWPRGELDPRLVFGVDKRNAPGATVNKVPAVAEPTPLFDGGLTKAMGGTGLRNDIGAYTGWLAKALRTGDWGDALRNAEAAASIPWHVRDDAGKLVLLTGPANLKRMLRTYYAAPLAAENMVEENTAWSLDQAHAPAAAWTGIVANSADPDPYMVEEVQAAAAGAVNQTHPMSKGADGMRVTIDQGRDWVWIMRSLAQARAVTPATVPPWLEPRETWQKLIDANLAPMMPLLGTVAFDRVSVRAGNYSGRAAKGEISEQTYTIDYVPLAMLHCYRLTGDARFLELGFAHLDARIAKRFRASPKYAFLFAPVTIGDGTRGVFFPTWAEAYKTRGWVSDESTPWASFLRPTGTEKDTDGSLLMSYGDPYLAYYLLVAELYRAAGRSSPDIDWLASFLTARRGSSVYNLPEQFAVAP